MTWFEKIRWQRADSVLLASVRGLLGDWSTDHQAIQMLRGRLLELQGWRCAYCQAPIEADANGHRELDHVLPKGPSHRCSKTRGMSNAEIDRRSTLGYSNFTYEPANLAVCCKQCNNLKGNYDGLLNRAQPRPLAVYPIRGQIRWVHPQLHSYSQHIEVNEDFVYIALTDEGSCVISVCRLDRVEVLQSKFLAKAISRSQGERRGLGYRLSFSAGCESPSICACTRCGLNEAEILSL